MPREGMDVEAVTSLSNQLGAITNSQFPSLVSDIDRLFGQIQSSWHGPDADQFVSTWSGTDKPALANVQHSLGAALADMNKNLADQQQASDASSA